MTKHTRTYRGQEIEATFEYDVTSTDPSTSVDDWDSCELVALEIMGHKINVLTLPPDVLAAIMDLATEID
jgi:hypothetical protein